MQTIVQILYVDRIYPLKIFSQLEWIFGRSFKHCFLLERLRAVISQRSYHIGDQMFDIFELFFNVRLPEFRRLLDFLPLFYQKRTHDIGDKLILKAGTNVEQVGRVAKGESGFAFWDNLVEKLVLAESFPYHSALMVAAVWLHNVAPVDTHPVFR
jgi:hypothetical protein